jgi:hypothetical protein
MTYGGEESSHYRVQIAHFGVAGAAAQLLFTGIRNAWDAVTCHVFVMAVEHRITFAARPIPPAQQ